MNKKELKELLKPLVKECVEESVREVVLTSGLLSQVISEVVKGMSPLLSEGKQEQERQEQSSTRYAEILKRSEKQSINQTRKQLLDSIGKSSYNGVNVFEGIKDSIPDEPAQNSPANPMSGIDPGDPGVDIDSLFDFNKAKILAQGKKR